MGYVIGIDTGGTYTDAVIYDAESKRVLAKGKSATTRKDLSEGIGLALDRLPAGLIQKAELVALSTTLATNACVENQGGRARLVLMGTNMKTLRWIGADRKYGLNYEDVLCIETKSTYDGKIIDHPDWDRIMEENDEFFREAEALSVAELNSRHNGAVLETTARDALRARYDVPVVMASELVSDMNVMERGATALLNARLLPVVDRFMKAVERAMKARGLTVPQMIVRSDASLMIDSLARLRPVETILSGPAASVMGSRALTDCADCLIVDMGGTTTDISIVRGGMPHMSGGIHIGGWRTQVKGVFIDTFGLGGDTRVCLREGQIALDTRRVEPICHAAAKWPEVRQELEKLLNGTALHTRPLHEFLYLVHEPADTARYSAAEIKLISQLRGGPQMIGGDVLDMYSLPAERLEQEGVIMRCGLTPTDIMHIRGDYSLYDAEASRLTARYFLRGLTEYGDDEEGMDRLCDAVYELVKRRLFENILRVFIEAAYPELCGDGLDGQLKKYISRRWETRGEREKSGFFELLPRISASLVGIGAPTHIFLPDVAKALGAECVIPEHSEVANAVGAAIADISARAAVEIRTNFENDHLDGYTIHANGLNEWYELFEDAVKAAEEAARRLACEEARRRGALGELTVETELVKHRSHARSGAQIDLGTQIIARASGRIAEKDV